MTFDIPTRALIVALKAPVGGAKSSNDIAAVTGIPVRTVNNIYVRAIKRGFVPHQLPLVLRQEFLEDAPRSGRPRTRVRREGDAPPPGHGVKKAKKKFGVKMKKTLPRDQQSQQQQQTATTSAIVPESSTVADVAAAPVDDTITSTSSATASATANAPSFITASATPSVAPLINAAPAHAAPLTSLPINFVVDQLHQEGVNRAHYHHYHRHHHHQGEGSLDPSAAAGKYDRQRFV